MRADGYDAIVIGAGQGGVPLACDLAASGRRTLLIERAQPGGTCVNVGCTPTKTMLAAAQVAAVARGAAAHGVRIPSVGVDLAAVIGRKRRIVERFRAGVVNRIRSAENLTYLEGTASFRDRRTVEVAATYGSLPAATAPSIIIDTGSRPSVPNIGGLVRIPFLNSTTIMELETLPERLLILGGGYVAVEFAQMFRRFGSEVTVVQRRPRLLTCEDQDVADALAATLRSEGIAIRLATNTLAVEAVARGRVCLRTTGPSGAETMEGTHLLVASGRVPNVEDLHLDRAGIAVSPSGRIAVDARLETSAAGVFALGDVREGPSFTHISYDDYRIVKEHLLDGGGRTTDGRAVPYCVFTDPQLGRIGMTEAEARAGGLDVRVAKMGFDAVARAIEMERTAGFLKAVVDRRSGRILGAAALGPEGGEIMAMIQIAMMGDLPYTALRDATFAHPTLAECLNSLFSRWQDA